MNAYQQKWIEVLNNAHIKDWKIEALNDDIVIDLPSGSNVNTILENLPEVVAKLSLDIDLPHERVKLILRNSGQHHEYIINPTEADLNTSKK
ncbi:hypothetical protein LLH06_13515 [Mucilaginibacter daejeonensis]|uniref:hypothetical protein n=1 Tax=Mucilaginibacter daejeonensis TaxID=398049 RepID=UPI001D17C47C|nr:hypothetical protein [Mucilaginibacter daejeonensis]UEG51981.1 hypothetical protein LLH06_13515 [Mucilaginibacter daejeonensis]